jgi:hypothetical protein
LQSAVVVEAGADDVRLETMAEVVVAVNNEVVELEGPDGHEGSNTVTLVGPKTPHTWVSVPSRTAAWTCCGVRVNPKIWLFPRTTDSTLGLVLSI